MSEFLNKLQIEQVEDISEQGRGTWKLLSEFKYQSDILQQIIIVPVGFVTDFCSVPRDPVIFTLLGDRYNYAGTCHDYLYDKTCTLNITRLEADKILKEMIIVQGGSKFIANLYYLGVRIGAGSHFRK